MSFRDGSWNSRFGAMGDEAEAVFEKVHPSGWDRWGLNRPSISVGKLKMKMRYTPDYRTSLKLVEVQGFGNDQTIKVKLDKLVALLLWDQDMPLDMFLWDSKNKRYAYVPIHDLANALHASATLESFPEGKRYWAIKPEQIEGIEWHDMSS